ncbi:MAG: IMP cyclohydrolase [Nanoarchaeota archaeon]
MYLGRVVFIGLTDQGIPYCAYAISGRSEASKERILKVDGNTVKTKPLVEELTPEQEEKRDLLFYDAIITDSGHKRAVVSNGEQTRHSFYAANDLIAPGSLSEIVYGFMKAGGPEPDDYRTPRITGILDVLDILRDYKKPDSALGIVTENGLTARFIVPERGEACFVSTYEGDSLEKHKIVIPDLVVPIDSIEIGGAKSAEDLAEWTYDWLEHDFRVGTAAAVWLPYENRFDLAVRNLHD